jgi:hypothetical protein
MGKGEANLCSVGLTSHVAVTDRRRSGTISELGITVCRDTNELLNPGRTLGDVTHSTKARTGQSMHGMTEFSK